MLETGQKKLDSGIRILIFIGLGLIFFISALLISVSVGSVSVPLADTIKILWNLFRKIFGMGIITGIDDGTIAIIEMVRLPRVLLAALVGASLSISGAAMQGLLKNPLADGSTLGVSSGGSLGAVIFIVSGIKITFLPELGLTLTSILFSFVSLLLILLFTYKIDFYLSTNTIILTGVIFSMFAGSLTSFLIAISGDSLKQVVFWSMGSFSGKGWMHVALMLPFFIAGSIFLMLLSKELNAFSMGEEQARYIGVNTKKIKFLILFVVSVLIGVSVSVSGTIGFVGLVIPHMTRMVTGPDHRKLLPLSLVAGAIFLMSTDLLSRTLLRPAEFPIGIVTSFIGSILFVYIFYSQKNRRERGAGNA